VDVDLQLLTDMPPLASAGHPQAEPALTVVVLARNEATILRRSLLAWTEVLGPKDELHVVADQCWDSTAVVAHEAGAIVHVRTQTDGPPGKGAALRWWLGEDVAAGEGRPVVILDADSRPAQDFFERVRQRLARGELAIQVRIEPLVESPTATCVLAALSERIEHEVFDPLRSRLGWPVRLRGTGMAFERSVLQRAAAHLSTMTEDIELTVLLAAQRVPISFCAETWVTDPKPDDSAGASRQRSRWLRGQLQVLGRHPLSIARIALRGPGGWWLLSSTLARPKTLLLPATLILAGAAFLGWTAAGGWILPTLSLVAAMSFVVDLAGLALGLRSLPDGLEAWKPLRSLPSFGWMWLRSLAISLMSREDWPSARQVPKAPSIQISGRES
jgi:cellulose synthase/poly-beta-1,6-N-acetylglucosamine synthase-like glycosyltransferase